MKITKEGQIVITGPTAQVAVIDFDVDCEGASVEEGQAFLIATAIQRLAMGIQRMVTTTPVVPTAITSGRFH